MTNTTPMTNEEAMHIIHLEEVRAFNNNTQEPDETNEEPEGYPY